MYVQYVYYLLFPKLFNRTNGFGINSKSHFDFIFTNWRHYKRNLVLPTPTKSKVVEQPIKKIIPEFNITQQKQQQQQNEQEQEEILRAGKRPESYEKRVVDPFKQKLEKNNVVLTLPTTPSPKLFGNTYPFEQKPERNSETTTTLPLSAVVTTTADSSRVKPFVPKAESVMDARVAKKS